MHPYSAIHVVQMRGALDQARLRASIGRTLEATGLTRLTMDGRRFGFRYEGGPADCEIRTIAGDDEPRSLLVAEMERQLNVRFDHSRPFSPFRFLVAPAADSFFLGVVYFHPAADAEAVAGLLKGIVTRYAQADAADFESCFDLYPTNRAHLLGRHFTVTWRKILALPMQIRNLRQSYRVRFRDSRDMGNGFAFFSVGPETVLSLVAAAELWQVTVNDLLMALLMKSLSPCAAARRQTRRRRKLSIGCIVNARKDLDVERRAFGVFLGSFMVTHKVPAEISLRNLAVDIRQQTAWIKRHKLYLATPLELGVARFVLRFFSPEQRQRFYAKNYPLWGGITNMNVNRLWDAADGNRPLDYFRGVSTGAIAPVVLSATTFGDRVNLGFSYRTAVFSKADIEALQRRFREHLGEARPDA